jgi:putative aminopeptidase FrvX
MLHLPVELCQLEDVANAAKLIAAFALRLDGAFDALR